MTLRFFLLGSALVVVAGASVGVRTSPPAGGPSASATVAEPVVSADPVAADAWIDAEVAAAVSDSALSELRAGRYWHAARLLRAEGAGEGAPVEVLTLARAEAGWGHWSAVADLLDGAPWLADEGDAVGLYLFGRALEESERYERAAEAFARYVESDAGSGVSVSAALARRARAEWRSGDGDVAVSVIEALAATPEIRSWVAAELALDAARDGDVGGVRMLLPHAIEPRAISALWRVEADALLAAGDSVEAAAAFRAVAASAAGGRRAIAEVELGWLRLAAGDTTGAAALFESAYAAGPAARVRAAQGLHDIGGLDATRSVEIARVLDRAGDGSRALAGYDRGVRLLDGDPATLAESARLARARLMATVRDRQEAALEEFRAIRETTENDRIGARNLEVWAQMRRRQGRRDAEGTLRRWLLEEYPGSPEAAEVAWSRGSNAEAAGRLDEALGHYGFVAENIRTHARAGQARMRTGQIHLRRARLGDAAEVFEQYLADFPDGRRWQEAAYWAGRTRLQLGDSAVARAHLERVLREPIQYYAVMAAELLGITYSVDLPPGPEPSEPGWMSEGLVRLDRLTEAGLDQGADDEIARLRERAEDDRAAMLRLAEALIERGRTIDGINLGWAILAEHGAWDQRLLRVTYPFPYEELVRREAREWGIDVFMMAAIIRQESAFKADIVSHAGAVGLMQVMPPTGAQLARAHGPSGFTERALTEPEVNLHLGAAFFVDMSRRYDDDLPLVLSAYNAGPTRATRWRRYPEAVDPLRFTERIPFVETRGYVKSVRRNLGLYRALYGQD